MRGEGITRGEPRRRVDSISFFYICNKDSSENEKVRGRGGAAGAQNINAELKE